MKTMHTLNWKPPILIGDDSGFFRQTRSSRAVGDLAQGVFNRSSYDIGKPGGASFVVNRVVSEACRPRAGRYLGGGGMQGFLALMEAINRAGSNRAGEDPGGADQSGSEGRNKLMIGYNGIKYDSKGQNTLAATLLVQLDGKKYVAVWPDNSAVHPPCPCPSKDGTDAMNTDLFEIISHHSFDAPVENRIRCPRR